jgi:hypothetical protein
MLCTLLLRSDASFVRPAIPAHRKQDFILVADGEPTFGPLGDIIRARIELLAAWFAPGEAALFFNHACLLLFSWCHLSGKSACFPMRPVDAYWCHFSAKSLAISTNGLIQNDSGLPQGLAGRPAAG